VAGQVIVRPMTDEDRAWAHALIDREWGGLAMVTRGALHDMRVLPGVVAWHEGARVGLATYRLDGAECEVMSLKQPGRRRRNRDGAAGGGRGGIPRGGLPARVPDHDQR